MRSGPPVLRKKLNKLEMKSKIYIKKNILDWLHILKEIINGDFSWNAR